MFRDKYEFLMLNMSNCNEFRSTESISIDPHPWILLPSEFSTTKHQLNLEKTSIYINHIFINQTLNFLLLVLHYKQGIYTNHTQPYITKPDQAHESIFSI